MEYHRIANGTADVSSCVTLRLVSAPQYGFRMRFHCSILARSGFVWWMAELCFAFEIFRPSLLLLSHRWLATLSISSRANKADV